MDVYAMTDDAIARLLGDRVERYRLQVNIPQEEVAGAVDISRPTYRNLTLGKTTIQTLSCVMNCLGRRHDFEELFPQESFSPLKVLEHRFSEPLSPIEDISPQKSASSHALPVLASRLDRLRETKGLSVPKLAYEAGITAPTMRLLLRGRGSLVNLISTLRVLEKLECVEGFLADVESHSGKSPLEALRSQRQRATGSRKTKETSDDSKTDLDW